MRRFQSEYSFERFSSRRLYYAFDFLPRSHDVIYSANTSGQFNIWRQTQPVGANPGPFRQLTGFDDWSVRYIAPHPSGRSIVAFADKDGNENYQIFMVDANEGWQQPLVLKPEVRHTFGIECFSPSGKFAAYSSNERAGQDMDIMNTEVSSRESRRVLGDGGIYSFGYWSPDGIRATVGEDTGADDTNIHLLNMRTGEKKNLTPHKDRTVYIPGPWTPRGDGFFLISDSDREFFGLAYLPVRDTPKLKWFETPLCDIEDVALSPNGRILAWSSNQQGYSYIHFRDVRTGHTLGRPVSTGGALTPGWFENRKLIKFSSDGRRLIWLLSTPTRPPEVYVLKVPELKIAKYTDGFIGNIPEKHMARPKLVEFQSYDRSIPAFLYKPQIAENQRAPVVLFIHGGPEAQERPWYSYVGLYQYLQSRGVGVLAPNIRGSTGYGKSYRRLIYHDWGGGELRDIEHAAKYLKGLDWVDPARIGVFGGSFGGFATLSAVTRLPEYWAVAVDIFGPGNLITFLKAVPAFWKRFMPELVGDPNTEADFLLSRSPITYIDDLKCPILIIQGANDPRVVKAESDQIVEKLRSKGREVEYIIFQDEGHGFTKRKNEFNAWKRASEFLLEHLLNKQYSTPQR
mgnify:CR=1 FL=1